MKIPEQSKQPLRIEETRERVPRHVPQPVLQPTVAVAEKNLEFDAKQFDAEGFSTQMLMSEG